MPNELISWVPPNLQSEVLGYLSRSISSPFRGNMDKLLEKQASPSPFSHNPALNQEFQYVYDSPDLNGPEGSSLKANAILEDHQGSKIDFDISIADKGIQKATLRVTPSIAVLEFANTSQNGKSGERAILDALPKMKTDFNAVADKFSTTFRKYMRTYRDSSAMPTKVDDLEHFFLDDNSVEVRAMIDKDPSLKAYWIGILRMAQDSFVGYSQAREAVEKGSAYFNDPACRKSASPKFTACPYALEMEKDALSLAADVAEGKLANAFFEVMSKPIKYDRVRGNNSEELEAGLPPEMQKVRMDNNKLVFDMRMQGGPVLLSACRAIEAATNNLSVITRRQATINNINVSFGNMDQDLAGVVENQSLPFGLKVSRSKHLGKGALFSEARLPSAVKTPFNEAKNTGYLDMAVIGASGSGKNMFESGILINSAKLNRDPDHLSTDDVLCYEFEGQKQGETAEEFWVRYTNARAWAVTTGNTLTALKKPVTLAVFFDEIGDYPHFPGGDLGGTLRDRLKREIGDASNALADGCVNGQARGGRVLLCQTGESLPEGIDPSVFKGHRSKLVDIIFSEKDIRDFSQIAVIEKANSKITEMIEKKYADIARTQIVPRNNNDQFKSYAEYVLLGLSTRTPTSNGFNSVFARLFSEEALNHSEEFKKLMRLTEERGNARYYFTNTSITDIANAIMNDPRMEEKLRNAIDNIWNGVTTNLQTIFQYKPDDLGDLCMKAVAGAVQKAHETAKDKAELRARRSNSAASSTETPDVEYARLEAEKQVLKKRVQEIDARQRILKPHS